MAMLNRQYGANYRFGFNAMEQDNEILGLGNCYSTEFREYDVRIARWFAIDPKHQFCAAQYSAFINNPNLFNDQNGAWIPGVASESNADGTKTSKLIVTKEEGDNAQTLSKFWGIKQEEADNLYKTIEHQEKAALTNNSASNKAMPSIFVPESIAGPINNALADLDQNPDKYGSEGVFKSNNYDCFESAYSTSQGKTPDFDNIMEGRTLCTNLINEDKYENVSGDESKYQFGRTLIRIGMNRKNIVGQDYNVTTHATIFLGKSHDGTVYVWSKEGNREAPRVTTLNKDIQRWGGIVQGASSKPHEGGYYNYVGGK